MSLTRDDIDRETVRELFTLKAMEKWREAVESRYAIICSEDTAETYFYQEMTAEERRAVSRMLVDAGKATWVHSEPWIR